MDILFFLKVWAASPETFLLQGDGTIEASNVFIDKYNSVSLRDREGSLKLVTDTGSLFLNRNTIVSSGNKGNYRVKPFPESVNLMGVFEILSFFSYHLFVKLNSV